MINIKRIIKEELEDVLDSFYLIVSEDEKFIYRRSHLGGYSWLPTHQLTPKEIINSGFKEYSEPEEMISRKIGLAGISSNQFPNRPKNIKIVPVDFIIKKREEDFPIIESKGDDFKWIEDTTPFDPGKLFDKDDICFNSKDCDININKDNITFKIDWEDWCEAVGVDSDDEWILKDILYFGPNHDGNGDYHEFDSDEFEFSGYHMDTEQKTSFQEMLNRIGPGLNFNDYSEDNMLSLNRVLKYPKLKKLFDDLIDKHLNTLGYVIQKNRWLTVGEEIRKKIKPTGVDFDLYSGKYGGEELQIIVPIDKVFKIYNEKNITDLSELVISVSTFLTENNWYEWFYDEWSTDGGNNEIAEAFNDFLYYSEKFLDDENLIGEYKKLEQMLDELGFSHLEHRYQINQLYQKENNDDTKWLLSIDENMNCILELFNSSENLTNQWSKPIPTQRWVFKSPFNVNEIKQEVLRISR